MKRLRNIAVRMRPPAPQDGALDLDTTELSGPVTSAQSAGRPTTSRQTSNRAGVEEFGSLTVPSPEGTSPHIWDLEDDESDRDLDGPISRSPTPVPASEPRATVAPPNAARSKTRVLGFADPLRSLDPLAEARQRISRAKSLPEAHAAEPRFPAGWLVIIDGPGRGADFAVTDTVSTIGRDADQAIRLDFGDSAISRQGHASVVYDAEQNRFFIGHGGKSNIVRHNGRPVLATEELFDGDDIRIGKTTLFFKALCGTEFTWSRDQDQQGHTND